MNAPLVVTGFTTANGVVTPGGTTTLDGTVTLPTNAAGSTVTVVKQSGNEFQVNPTQPASVYTANQAPLNASQPAVAIDGSGDFVITWAGEVSQNLAPKSFTDVYARMYAPVGVTPAGTAVPSAVSSDLYQQQVLQFAFPAGSATPTTGETFELQLGSFVTSPITWDTNLNTTAYNIQTALAANPAYADVMAVNPNYIPLAVSAQSSGNPYDFLVAFNEGGIAEAPIQYVADPTNAAAFDFDVQRDAPAVVHRRAVDDQSDAGADVRFHRRPADGHGQSGHLPTASWLVQHRGHQFQFQPDCHGVKHAERACVRPALPAWRFLHSP